MADPGLGTLSNVMIDLEASWGVARTTTASGKKLAVVSEGIVPTMDLIDNPSMRGDFNFADPVSGNKAASGPLVIVPNLKLAPFFAAWLAGGISTTGAADPYTHVIKPGTSMPYSCVIEKSITAGGVTKYSLTSGARINSWRIPIDPAGIQQWSLDILAKDNVPNGAASYDSDASTDWRTGSPVDQMTLLAADCKLGGSSVGYIQKGEISIAANLRGDDYRVGGGGARGSLVPGKLAVTGSLTLVVDDTALLATVLAGAPTTLSFKWTEGANDTLKIDLPRVFIQKTGWALQNDGPITIDVQYRAVYDGTALAPIVFTIVNDQAGTVYA